MEEKVTTVVPKGMEIFQNQKWSLTQDQKNALVKNFIKYVAPTLALFFASLAKGLPFWASLSIASLAFWQVASDFFTKLSSDTPILREKE